MPPRTSNRSKAKQSRLFAFSNESKTQSVKSSVLEHAANGNSAKNSISLNNGNGNSNSEELPSVMISEILKLLQLSYDSNVGMLTGDLVFISNSSQLASKLTTPMLVNLKNLIKQLKKGLKSISNDDNMKILKLKAQILKDSGKILFTRTDLDFIKLHELQLDEYGVTPNIQQSIIEIDTNSTEEQTEEKEIIKEDTSLMALETKRITKDEEHVIESVEEEIQNDAKHKRWLESDSDTNHIKRIKTEDVSNVDTISTIIKESATMSTGNDITAVPSTQYPVELSLNEPAIQEPQKYFDTKKFLEAAKRLHLFQGDHQLEEKKDPEYLKKLYGVAAYPKDFYLRDYLTGDIPDTDFSTQKEIKNKVNFNNFLTYTDNYFRNFDDQDLVFLKRKFVYSSGLDTFYQSNFNKSTSLPSANTNSASASSSSATSTNMTAPNAYDPKVYPFIIPKLGKHYSRVWAEEDATKLSNHNKELTEFQQIKDFLIPKSSSNSMDDMSLNNDSVSCGPLVSRLMAAILPEKEVIESLSREEDNDINGQDSSSQKIQLSANADSQDDSTKDKNFISTNNNENSIYYVPESISNDADSFDYATLEERLRRELKFVGVYLNYKNEVAINKKKLIGTSNDENLIDTTKEALNADEDIMTESFDDAWVYNKQDDEVSRELRALQSQLKIVNVKNNYRKFKLFKRLYEEISFREFYNILENLNKQIDQYYAKKQKVLVRYHKRHNKKHTPVPHDEVGSSNGSLSHQQVIDKTLNSLIEKRDKWIEKIGPLFNYHENIQLRNLPSQSIFNPKISKMNDDNFDDFYEVYSKYFSNSDDDEDEEEDEKLDKSLNGDGILLSDGVRIKKDELKLKESMKEIDLERNLSSIKILDPSSSKRNADIKSDENRK